MIDSFGLLAGGRPAPFSLKSLHWKGTLDGLLFTYTVTQLYKNTTETPLEISYSFPMSWNSVLTDFAAEINGEVLHAEPMRKKDAEARYEKALEKGDLPLMLECSDPANGVCTANLGCLKPGEEVKLLLTFAQVLRFELGRVRISIPTVVGDRYSADGRQGALLPHQNVTQNVLANYPASAEIEICGPVADSSVTCSNHIASFEKKDGVLTVRIAQATPNRDITLLCEGVVPFADAKFAKKTDGTAASLITSVYKPETAASKKALRLKILADCSGSMNGIPIYQAKAALRDLMEELREEDEITFSRFGSGCVHDIQSFTALTKTALRRDILPAIEETDADMGGTEMEAALSSVFALGGAEKADVLLITDGEIWNSEKVVETAKKSGHRVFAIGVSSSPAQSVLRDLASKTGGAASVVMPAEDMADAVSSMVRLMRSEQGAKLSLFGEEREAPQTLFAGTGFAVPSAGKELPALDSFVPEELKNSVLKPEGWTELPEDKAAVLEKLYALSIMKAFEGPKAAEAAQKYGVLSWGVNFILVKERAEADKCFEMPQAEVVPEMPVHADRYGFTIVDPLEDTSCITPREQLELYKRAMSVHFSVQRQCSRQAPFPRTAFMARKPQESTGAQFRREVIGFLYVSRTDGPYLTAAKTISVLLFDIVKEKFGVRFTEEAAIGFAILVINGKFRRDGIDGVLSEEDIQIVSERCGHNLDLAELYRKFEASGDLDRFISAEAENFPDTGV
jgi:Ca-activated chloride channel family protein